MSDTSLRLQVILKAVDNLTRPFKSAEASSHALASAIAATQGRLNVLNNQSARIDTFRQTRAELKQTASALSAARSEASRLGVQFAATSRPTAEQAERFSQARQRVRELQQSYTGLQQTVQQQRQTLKASGIDTTRLSSAQRALRGEADATQQTLEQQQQSQGRLQAKQARLNAARDRYARTLAVRDRVASTGAALTSAGQHIGGPVMAAVKSYASLEKAMQGVAHQVPGLRDAGGKRTPRYDDLQARIKTASEQVALPDGATGFAKLVADGANLKMADPRDSWEDQQRDLLSFADTVAKASTAFQLPTDTLSAGLSSVAQLYRIPTRNVEQLGDTLYALDAAAGSKGIDVINVLQQMGEVAGRLDYRHAAALGSTLLSLDVDPARAGGSASTMINTLSSATGQSKSVRQGLKTLDLDPQGLEQQMTRDAMGTLQRVLEKVNGLPKDKRSIVISQIFGQQSGSDALKLAGNLPELQRRVNLASDGKAVGSLQRGSDADKDSLSTQYQLVKNSGNNLLSNLGETLRQPLLDVLGTIKTIIVATNQWVTDNPQLAATLMKVAMGAGAIASVVGPLATGLSVVMGPLGAIRFGMSVLGTQMLPLVSGVFSTIGSVFSTLASGPMGLLRMALSGVSGGLGLLLSPVTLVVAALIGAGLLIWRFWDPISAFMGGVVAGFSAAAAPIIGAFAPLKPIFEGVKTTVKSVWDWFTSLLTPVASTSEQLDSAASMGRNFGQMLAGALNMVLHPLDTLKSGLSSVLEALGLAKKEASTVKLPELPVTPYAAGVGTPAPTAFSPYPTMMSGGYVNKFDRGGTIPAGEFGVVGENGPEIVGGPVSVISRRRTAALAAVGAMSFATAAAEPAPLHPFSLPASSYQAPAASLPASPRTLHVETHAPVTIYAQPGQSAQDIAREVARQLEERERRAFSQAQSSYRDRGGYDI